MKKKEEYCISKSKTEKFSGKSFLKFSHVLSKENYHQAFIKTEAHNREIHLKLASVFLFLIYKYFEYESVENIFVHITLLETEQHAHAIRLKNLAIDGKSFCDLSTDIKKLLESKETPDDSNLAIFLSFNIEEGNCIIDLEYDANIINIVAFKRIFTNFESILNIVLDNPEIKLTEVELISWEEKFKLREIAEASRASYPKQKTIHMLFEEQVARTPDNIALSFDNKNLSYRALNNKANQIAKLLREKMAITREDIVGMLINRSPEMIAGILGILKAGGAYLPLEPSFPQERINSILADSNAAALLTSSKDIAQLDICQLQKRERSSISVSLSCPRAQLEDFDSLPFPDRSLVDYEKYNKYIGQAMVKNAIAIQATRGCPYNCTYCHKIWPKKHIVRSAEKLFEEVTLYYKLGIKRFIIIDDIFNLNIKNSSKFFELIIKNNYRLQLYFPNGLRGDILTREYIDLMVEAGAISFALALETASPRLQKLIKKNLNIDKLYTTIEYISTKYPEVILELFTMHGFPTETEKEALMTLDFIKSIKWLHFPYVHILKIYPDTDMEKLALECGVSKDDIDSSLGLAYHELPATLPFSTEFTLNYQSQFLNEYFLKKERLLKVLPLQMKTLSEDEFLQKYNSYLPVKAENLEQFLEFTRIPKNMLAGEKFAKEDNFRIPDLNNKFKNAFPAKKANASALKILFMDLSQFFSSESNMLYDVVEPPLGLMYVLSYLNEKLGDKIDGKLVKSRIDFNSYDELKTILTSFKPDIIGIRCLTFYRSFMHKTASVIRQWGYQIPIIVGGPYATSSYVNILKDYNIDVAVLGEGEVTTLELMEKIIAHNKQLPVKEILEEIPGIAFIPNKKELPRKEFNRELLILDKLPETGPEEKIANLQHINQPGDLCYIIYTSGSTGKPKGAMIEHRNVVRLLFNSKMQFDFKETDAWSLFHSYCFDFSVWEMYGALLYGGKLVVVPKQTAKNPKKFLEILKNQQVTVLNQVPSVFYGLIEEEMKCLDSALSLRYVIFGGEALKPVKLREFHEKYPATKLINMYGITETTVHVTYKDLSCKDLESNISNIGKAIPTLTTYIMDKNQKSLPVGVVGELCVGGDGVGRGYLNNSDLTNEKFVTNPYNKKEIIYKSGDLARMLPDGDLEYLGRIDHQVKLRGFRIELGDIEHQLLNHKGIKEVIILAKENGRGEKYLCAYLVAKEKLSAEELRNYLSHKLPDYMIPSHFVFLDKLPLTANGKIARNMLPEPSLENRTETTLSGPRNAEEESLLKIWQEVLAVEKIGIFDNFFELGGNSISFVKLNIMVESTFNVEFDVKDFMKVKTISDISSLLQANDDKVPNLVL